MLKIEQNRTSGIVSDVLAAFEQQMIAYSQQHGDSLEERLHESAVYFGTAYSEFPMQLNYHSPYRGYTYIYKYATSHGEIIDHVLRSCSAIQKIWREVALLKVASFGGGPGSELLGLARFLTETRQSQQFYVVNYDREPQWEVFFPTMCNQISRNYSIAIDAHQVYFDITQEQATQEYVSQADLFFFNYVFTEVYSSEASARIFLNRLARSAKPGALMIFIDNGYEGEIGMKYIKYVRDLVNAMGLRKLVFRTIDFEVDSPRYPLDAYRKFFQQKPLWGMKVSYHICQKQGGSL